MKRYYNNDNLDIDPTRLLFHNNTINNNRTNTNNNTNNNNNNLLLEFNRPISKLQDDILINNISREMVQPIQRKKKTPLLSSYTNDDDISLQFLPKNNQQMVPFADKNSVTNYNNEKFRLKNMSQELMDKDEDIQKYKNEVYQLQIRLNESKKEKEQMISQDIENQLLRDKLNEQYKLSKELDEMKHRLTKERINSESNKKTIHLLKNIIHKQHTRLTTKNYVDSTESEDESDDESEEESDEEYTDDSDESEEEESIQKKYYNHNLKKALLKQKLPSKRIDEAMVLLKITPRTKLTKKLLTNLLSNMKK